MDCSYFIGFPENLNFFCSIFKLSIRALPDWGDMVKYCNFIPATLVPVDFPCGHSEAENAITIKRLEMNIKMAELIGENCESIDDGEKLYQSLISELRNGRAVELDFTDVQSVITPFLNASIGKLLDLFEKETLMEKLVLCHISEDHLRRINEFIDFKHRKNLEATTRDLMRDLFEEDELGED